MLTSWELLRRALLLRALQKPLKYLPFCHTSHLRYNLNNLVLEIKLILIICSIIHSISCNRVKGLTNHSAEQIILKLVQKKAFTTDFETLINRKDIYWKSKVAQYCPILGEQVIIRARQRWSKMVLISKLTTQTHNHPNILWYDWWCWNVIWTTTSKVLEIWQMNCNKN